MKKSMFHFNKPNLLAIIFFVTMMTFSFLTAKAQGDTINPLFGTTGPNVIGKGHLQWDNAVDYYDIHVNSIFGFDANLHSLGYKGALRYGIGNRAELSFNLEASYNTWDTVYLNNNTSLNPTFGAKLQLCEGKGLLPQTTFYTRLGATIFQTAYEPQRWDGALQPEIGFQFRNRIGGRWAIDYSLGYAWNEYSVNAYGLKSQLRYSLYGRWLATDRLMLGVGMTNDNAPRRFAGNFELRYLARPDMQLSAQFGVAGSKGDLGGDRQINALVGFSWMIR